MSHHLLLAFLFFAVEYGNCTEPQTEQRRALSYGVWDAYAEQRSVPRSGPMRAVEDEKYWDVFFQAIDSLPGSVPTKTTTSAPTPRQVTPTPTLSPLPGTNAPTRRCQIDLELTCMVGDGSSCKEIKSEDQFLCSCSECPREIIFLYTGSSCNDFDGCQDIGDGQASTSRIMISNANDLTDILYVANVNQNSQIVVSRSEGSSCLPEAMNIQIANVQGDEILQAVSINSSCKDGGLQLLESYGALDFIGYSCDANDHHNCFINVLYEFDTCNIGSTDQTLLSLSCDLDGDITDLLTGRVPSDGLVLGPNECFKASQREVVEVCQPNEYYAKAIVGGGNSINGVATCEDEDELKFGWEVATMSPSAPPTAVPSPQPSASPPPRIQTQGCSSNIEVECVTIDGQDLDCGDIVEETNRVCQCSECARQLSFAYTGGSCEDYQGDPDQCIDNIDTASAARFVVTAGDDMNNVFFNDIRQLDGLLLIEDDDGGCLPETLTVTVFSTDGSNTVLQTQTIDAACDGTGYLTLTTSYGAVDFVGYSCDETDVHNCLVDVLFKANTCNNDDANDLILFGMDFYLNGSKDNLLGETAPRTLEPEECLQYSIPSAVERCVGSPYVASVTVDSSLATDPEAICTDSGGLAFHTFSLRSSLTDWNITFEVEDTFNNTQDEDELLGDTSEEQSLTESVSSCEIQAEIQCRVTDGLETEDCESIQSALITECRGEGVVLQSLAFNYTGRSCSNTPGIHCSDYSSSWNDDEVFLTIRDRDLKIYVEQTVNIGDVVHVMNPSDFFEVLVETARVDENGRNQGERLQRFLINPFCREEETSSTLTLGKDYGALSLVSLKTDQFGLQSIFAEVEIQYFVTNPSAVNALIMTSAAVSSSLTGRLGEQLTLSGPDNGLVYVPNSGTATLLVERRRLNLLMEASKAFVFAINAHASTVHDDGEIQCSDLKSSFFRLQDIALSGK
jgi:hypothetical protein